MSSLVSRWSFLPRLRVYKPTLLLMAPPERFAQMCRLFFPKAVPRVSAVGLFTSKCFCDSPKQHGSLCFLFPFFSFFCYKDLLFSFFFPPLVSKMAGCAVSKQSLVPINLWFPLRNPQTSRVLKDLKQTVHAQTHCAHTHTHALMSWRTIWKYSSFLPSHA